MEVTLNADAVATITRELLDELKSAAPGASERALEDSGWLEGKSLEELAQTQKRYLLRLQDYVAEAQAVLGEPTDDTESVAAWYPEVIASYAWAVDGGVYALSAVQHDAETPIGLTLRYVTQAEMEALRA